jgi:hypothetical protein
VLAAATLVVACLIAAPAQAYVYWTVSGNGQSGTGIGRADQDGSSVNHAFVSGASGPTGIVTDGAHIYWANSQTNSIGRANLDGSAADPTFIPNATTGSGLPTGVAVDGSSIYWTDLNQYVGKANLDGTNSSPHWVDDGAGSAPVAIAASGGNVYFSDFGARIREVASGGTTPSTLVTLGPSSTNPLSMAIAGGYIYYSVLNSGSGNPPGAIGRVSISGTGAKNNFIPGLYGPTGVATDGHEIYWVDSNVDQHAIGRAQLTASGFANAQYNWISEPGGPWGVAVNDNVDATQTAVACSPSSVAPGQATACTATVTDSASSTPPGGTVSFSSNGSTFFSGSGSSCTLAAQSNGTRSCTVGVVPIDAGTAPINATYAGDPLHSSSTGSTSLCVSSAGTCGGGAGGGGGGGGGGSGGGGGAGGGGSGGGHACIVPKLKDKTLAQARKLLAKAHCKLGKVKRPKGKKAHKPLVIGSQTVRAGKHLRSGARIGVRLKPRSAKHRR